MSTTVIDERCSCGATFRYSTTYARNAAEQVAAFRKNHRHEMPPPVVVAGTHPDPTPTPEPAEAKAEPPRPPSSPLREVRH